VSRHALAADDVDGHEVLRYLSSVIAAPGDTHALCGAISQSIQSHFIALIAAFRSSGDTPKGVEMPGLLRPGRDRILV
jgi:hypothetical protein